jgi:hypothetical protein
MRRNEMDTISITFTKEEFNALYKLTGNLNTNLVVDELHMSEEDDEILFRIYNKLDEREWR